MQPNPERGPGRAAGRRLLAGVWWAVCGAVAGLAASPVQASGLTWASCPTPPAVAAGAWDAHLQLAALVQAELLAQSAPVALISRSGLNLGAIGHRYSHAAWVRPVPGNSITNERPWTVRQLYFDCETAQPRIFDEGLPGFVRGVAADALPRLSVVWWPDEAHAALARAVADDALALALLSAQYQAQAHAWSLHSQNCNQWLVEMLAAALGGARNRADAQAWLRQQGYGGTVVQLPWVGWLWAAALWPHMGLRHHPDEDLERLRFEVSLPESIERFVRRQWPQARRVEWCLRGREVVVNRSWEPLDESCTPRGTDERRPLDP